MSFQGASTREQALLANGDPSLPVSPGEDRGPEIARRDPIPDSVRWLRMTMHNCGIMTRDAAFFAASLVAVAGRYRHPMTAFGATAREYGSSALGLHARAEAMGLRAVAAVRLKCALGHRTRCSCFLC
jgi:hypothetical protein